MPPFDAHLLSVLRWLWATPLPPEVDTRARLLLLDTVGCAIAGTAEPEVAALFRFADPGPVRFPGTPHSTSSAGFARAFAAAACWHEACEGLALAHGRPGLHAIPAVLGSALAAGASLGAVLDAVAAGFEVGGRLGAVCRIRPGMHVDGTWGSFAAAAAAARFAGLSPEDTLAALNHAACHMPFSLYFPIPAGSTARNAFPGHGAAHGMAAVQATRAGLGGPPGAVAEMARLALDLPPEALLAAPGPGAWLLPDGYLKPYPAVRHVHYGVAAAAAWRGRPRAITAVTLDAYPEALTYCGNRAPGTAIQAQFSLSYGVAHALVHGTLDPSAYTSARLHDPAVRRVEALVVPRPDPARVPGNRRGCTLTVEADGSTWSRTVDHVPGDPGHPMPGDAVERKFTAYAGPVIGADHAAGIAERLLRGLADAPLDFREGTARNPANRGGVGAR